MKTLKINSIEQKGDELHVDVNVKIHKPVQKINVKISKESTKACTCINFQGEHEEDCQTRF